MILPQSRLSRLTLASLTTLLGVVGTAHANPVLSASTAASVFTNSTSSSPGTDLSYISSSSNISDLTGRGYGYSFANAGGAYAVSANANGVASGSANAQFVKSYENTSGVAQHYTLSFHIYGGYISVANVNRELQDSEKLTASYTASLKFRLNGGAWSDPFSSSATVTRIGNNSTLVRSGENLYLADDIVTDHRYDWSGAYYDVDLGIVGANDIVEVQADVQNRVESDVGVYSFTGQGCDWQYGTGCYGGFAGEASSFYGDPLGDPINMFDLGGTSGAADPFGFVPTTTAVTQDLPEPASLALVSLALGAAGAAKRRRRG